MYNNLSDCNLIKQYLCIHMDLKNYKGDKFKHQVKSGSSSADLFIVVLLFFIFLLSAYYFRSGGGEVSNKEDKIVKRQVNGNDSRGDKNAQQDFNDNFESKVEECDLYKFCPNIPEENCSNLNPECFVNPDGSKFQQPNEKENTIVNEELLDEDGFWSGKKDVAPDLPDIEEVKVSEVIEIFDRELVEGKKINPINVDNVIKKIDPVQSERRSLDSRKNTTIRFINKSNEVRKIYWLDYTGNKVHYKTLYPDDSYFQNTFMTHPWLITDVNGKELSVHYPKESISDVILEAVGDIQLNEHEFAPPPIGYQQVVPPKYQDLIGKYRRLPYENTWHDVTVEFKNDKLMWSNAANRSWQLHDKGDKFRTGRDCPYGVKDVIVEFDSNSVVIGLWFQNERYTKQ